MSDVAEVADVLGALLRGERGRREQRLDHRRNCSRSSTVTPSISLTTVDGNGDRCPELRLAGGDAQPRWKVGMLIRGPRALSIAW